MGLLQKLSFDPLGLITPEREEQLRAEARKKVQEKLRKKAEADLLEALMEETERELMPKPEYEMRSIVIDVAEHTAYIKLDNRYYFYGQRYDVPKPVYDQLVEIIARGWRHEKEISAPSGPRSNNRNVTLHGNVDMQGASF